MSCNFANLVKILRPNERCPPVSPPNLDLSTRIVVQHLSSAVARSGLVKVGHADDDRAWAVFEVRVVAKVIDWLFGSLELLWPEK